MATASRNVRKTRRLKRQRTIAFKIAKIAIAQRDQARMVAGALEQELKKHLPTALSNEPVPSDPAFTITSIANEESEDQETTSSE